MDPNATLAEMRRLLVNIQKDDDAADDDTPMPFNPFDVRRLVELAEALDQWISTGGFLPAVWEHAGRVHRPGRTPAPDYNRR